MARPNRVSIRDGIYHASSRFIDNHTWLQNEDFKTALLERIYAFAEFAGIELLEWNIMDNGFDMIFHVPRVPKGYWTTEEEPDSYANGMRPVEIRVPLWPPIKKYPKGPLPTSLRAPVAFLVDDVEMIKRLSALYGDELFAKAKIERWQRLRSKGKSDQADSEKRRYCARMYNVSQYMKTVNEWVAGEVKKRFNRSGHVFGERFHSALIDNTANAQRIASLNLNYEPCRAKLCEPEENYYWNSFGRANLGGRLAHECRRALIQIWSPQYIEKTNGAHDSSCSPQDIEKTANSHDSSCSAQDIEKTANSHDSSYSAQDIEKTANSHDSSCSAQDIEKTNGSHDYSWSAISKQIRSDLTMPLPSDPDLKNQVLAGKRSLAPGQLIKLNVRPLSHAYYISDDIAFAEKIDNFLPPGFPRPGFRNFEALVNMLTPAKTS